MEFNFFNKKKRRIYLDHVATTPVAREVFLAMQPYFKEHFGNPSAIYKEGVFAKRVIEESRRELSRVLNVRNTDLIFTSGGTESNHLAIHGVIEYLRKNGRAYNDMEVITTRMEHPSVLESLNVLAERGVKVSYVQPDTGGLIQEPELLKKLSAQTVLVTFAYVNSEIGVVQNVKHITRVVRKYATEQNVQIKIHLDASQAPLWLSCQVDMLGIDLMTLDAGKCYGPKGVGVLVHRKDTPLSPILIGGGQEFGLRAGTENTALIIGCVKAIIRAQNNWKERSEKVSKLRGTFLERLLKNIPNAVLNGSKIDRVANNVNISIPGIDTEFAVVVLDTAGIATSTKSACSGADSTGSKVVLEISNDHQRATSTVRFTLGETTTEEELEYTERIFVEHIRKMGAFKLGQNI